MAFLKNHPKTDMRPGRQVNMLGRTMPYAYHARRSAQPAAIGRQLLKDAVSVRQAKRAAHYWRQRFGLVLVMLAIVIGVGNLLMLDVNPVVKPVHQTGDVAFLHPLSTYQQAAERLLAGSLLNRNKITVDTSAVVRGLKKAYPELSVVSVTLPLFGHRPYVYVAQADPALLLQSANGRNYIIDTEGRAIAAGNNQALPMRLVFVRDESGASIQLGALSLPSTTVSFINAVHFQLAQRQVHIDHYSLPVSGSELDAYPDGVRYFVKFNLASGTALQQVGTFLATQQYFEGRGINPSQYVDVRLDGRAYYK